MLEIIAGVVTMFRWRLYAYLLMPDSLELLVETPEPNLSAGMRQINGIYTQHFNRRHDRTGPLFRGRFKALLIEAQNYLLAVARDMAQRPARQKLGRRTSDPRWTSFRYNIGEKAAPGWLAADALLEFVHARSKRDAMKRYAEIVRSETSADSPFAAVKSQLFLGSDSFRRRMQAISDGSSSSRKVSRRNRLVWRPEIREIVRAVAAELKMPEQEIESGRGGDARLAVAHLGRVEAALSLGEVGRPLHLGAAAVSRMASEGERRMQSDPSYARFITRVRKRITSASPRRAR